MSDQFTTLPIPRRRLDELASTILQSRDHILPSMKDGVSAKLSVAQILGLIEAGDLAGKLLADAVGFTPNSASPLSATDVASALEEIAEDYLRAELAAWRLIDVYDIAGTPAAQEIPLPLGYDLFEIDMIGVVASANQNIRARLSVDGVNFIATSSYSASQIYNRTTTPTAVYATTNELTLLPGAPSFSSNGPAANAAVRIFPGSVDTAPSVQSVATSYVSGSDFRGGIAGGYLGVADRVLGIQIYPASGTLIAGGKFVLRGLVT